MSRAYRMTIAIDGFNRESPDIKFDVMNAAEEQGGFSLEKYSGTAAWGTAETSLRNGETEQQYVDRVTNAIWGANKQFCEVIITCCCLENPPLYLKGPHAYQEWMKSRGEIWQEK